MEYQSTFICYNILLLTNLIIVSSFYVMFIICPTSLADWDVATSLTSFVRVAAIFCLYLGGGKGWIGGFSCLLASAAVLGTILHRIPSVATFNGFIGLWWASLYPVLHAVRNAMLAEEAHTAVARNRISLIRVEVWRPLVMGGGSER